jgi:hypothetical protein
VYDGTTNWTPQGTVQAAAALRASGRDPALIAYDASATDFINAYVDAGDRNMPTMMIGGSSRIGDLKAYKRAQDEGFDPNLYLMASATWMSSVALEVELKIKNGETPSSEEINYPMGFANAEDVIPLEDLSMPDFAIPGAFIPGQDVRAALNN